jgi:Tfx family DNA-binding protein
MIIGSSNESQVPEEVHKPEETMGPLLTKRQLRVLQLRRQGLSQAEVAKRLGTTRSNISILEKRAHQNIQRAERTIHQWMMIQAPISLSLKAGTDVFDLPKMIFEAADKISMRLPITSLDIVVQLRRKAPRIFKKRSLEQDTEIYVTEDGEILVEAEGKPGSKKNSKESDMGAF